MEKLLAIIVLSSVFVSCHVRNETSSVDLARSKTKVPTAGPSKFMDLYAIVKENSHSMANSLEQFIHQNHAFTLMHDSNSSQKSSKQRPRAIVFDRYRGLIVAFGGDPDLPGYSKIETAEFDQVTSQILLREIVFKSHIGKKLQKIWNGQWKELLNRLDLSETDIDETLTTNDIIVTKPNPRRCLTCHIYEGTDIEKIVKFPHEKRLVRYIWEAYDQWPQAYGAVDDALTLEEFEDLKKFKKDLGKRYATLPFLTSKHFPKYYPYDKFGRSKHLLRRPNLGLLKVVLLNTLDQLTSRYPIEAAKKAEFIEQIKRVCTGKSSDFATNHIKTSIAHLSKSDEQFAFNLNFVPPQGGHTWQTGSKASILGVDSLEGHLFGMYVQKRFPIHFWAGVRKKVPWLKIDLDFNKYEGTFLVDPHLEISTDYDKTRFCSSFGEEFPTLLDRIKRVFN